MSSAVLWTVEVICHGVNWWVCLGLHFHSQKYISLFYSYLVLGKVFCLVGFGFSGFYSSKMWSLCITLAVLEQDQAGLKLKDPPTSASQELGLKALPQPPNWVFYYRNRKWFIRATRSWEEGRVEERVRNISRCKKWQQTLNSPNTQSCHHPTQAMENPFGTY